MARREARKERRRQEAAERQSGEAAPEEPTRWRIGSIALGIILYFAVGGMVIAVWHALRSGDEAQRALLRASASGNVKYVRDLIGVDGINVNQAHEGDFGLTPLLAASQNGHEEVVRVLLGNVV